MYLVDDGVLQRRVVRLEGRATHVVRFVGLRRQTVDGSSQQVVDRVPAHIADVGLHQAVGMLRSIGRQPLQSTEHGHGALNGVVGHPVDVAQSSIGLGRAPLLQRRRSTE